MVACGSYSLARADCIRLMSLGTPVLGSSSSSYSMFRKPR